MSSFSAIKDYLCKRYSWDKNLSLWVIKNDGKPFPSSGMDLSRLPEKLWPNVESLPELAPLKQYFEVVLFRWIGSNLSVVCINESQRTAARAKEIHDCLLKAGEQCLSLAGESRYQYCDIVLFETIDVYNAPIPPADKRELTRIRRLGVANPRISISSFVLSVHDKKVWSNLSLIGHYFRRRWFERLLREMGSPDEVLYNRAVRAGMGMWPATMLCGVGGGAAAIAAKLALVLLGVKSGLLFGLVDFVVCIGAVGAGIYVRPRKKANMKLQTALTVSLYCIVLYGVTILLGTSVPAATLFNWISFTIMAMFIGITAEVETSKFHD